MTHEELLAEIQSQINHENYVFNDEPNDWVLPWLALRAVVELHKPIEYVKQFSDGEILQGEYVCNVCNWNYPCQTIQTIEKELNG